MIFKFTKQYKEQDKKIQKLERNIETYGKEINVLKMNNRGLKNNIYNLEIQKQRLEKYNENLQSEIELLKKEIYEFKKENKILKKIVDDFEKKEIHREIQSLELEKKEKNEIKVGQEKCINILKHILHNKESELQKEKKELIVARDKFIDISKKILDNKYKEQREKIYKELRDKKYKELIELLSYEYLSLEKCINKINFQLYDNENIQRFMKNIMSKDVAVDRFIQMIIDIYSLEDGTEYYKLYEKVFSEQFIDKMSKTYLSKSNYEKTMINYRFSRNIIKNDKYFIPNKYGDLQKGEIGFIDIFIYLKKSIQLDQILLGLIFSPDKLNQTENTNRLYDAQLTGTVLDFTYNEVNFLNDEDRKILYFMTQFLYAYIFVCYIIFLKQVKILINNKELVNILTNIKKEKNEIEHIMSKFYPIYENFYDDAFYKKFTRNELEILVFIFNDIELSEGLLTYNYYDQVVENLKKDMNMENLINNIDSNKFVKFYNIKYLKESNINEYYCELINYLFIKTREYLKKEDVLKILFKKEIYIEKLKINEELKKILKEKNKYLFNENIETKKKPKKLMLSEVTTGNEFEHFLKHLFSKLGYNATVTKASQDQGADLVIEKNNERTVVQAKFYSNKVGNKAIQEVIASKLYYKANNCMVVTNNSFTHAACELARVNEVILINGIELKNMIETANILTD